MQKKKLKFRIINKKTFMIEFWVNNYFYPYICNSLKNAFLKNKNIKFSFQKCKKYNK